MELDLRHHVLLGALWVITDLLMIWMTLVDPNLLYLVLQVPNVLAQQDCRVKRDQVSARECSYRRQG